MRPPTVGPPANWVVIVGLDQGYLRKHLPVSTAEYVSVVSMHGGDRVSTDEAVRAAVLNATTTPDLLATAILAVLDFVKSMETDFEGNRSVVGCAMAEQIRHEISVVLGVTK